MSDMKCPVCQKPLEQVGTSRQYQCGSWGCDASFNMIGTTELWQALIQAKQDLEIARKALEEIKKHNKAMLSVLGEQIPKESTDTEEYCWWASCRIQDCLKALEQIDHIADVSKMIGQN